MTDKYYMAKLSRQQLRQLLDQVSTNELKHMEPETRVRNWMLIPLIWEVIVARELFAELGVSNLIQEAMASQEPYEGLPDELKEKLQ